ncbi:hypothetical protein AWENTII_006218 [Aspergillus wentii]
MGLFFGWIYFLQNVLSFLTKKNPMAQMIEHQVPGKQEGTLTVRDDRTGHSYTIPIIHNAVPALGFRQIVKDRKNKTPRQQFEEGLRVIDPGYRNTAVKMSGITYINGEQGVILYRGHPLGSLVGKSYEEITHLLVWGSLPTESQRLSFQRKLAEAMVLPDVVRQAVTNLPRDVPATVLMGAALTAYLSVHPEYIPAYVGKNLYNGKMDKVDEQLTRTLGISAVTISIVFCHKHGREFRPADLNRSYIENLLHMGGFTEGNPNVSPEKAADIFTRLWALYADHEMTNSTSAYLHTASALTDPISSLIACLQSAYGLLHGGAIDAAYTGMREIGGPENVPHLINKVVNKEARLSGYGHRIYKLQDPRAGYIKEMLDELTHDTDIRQMDPVLAIAMEIDRMAGQHEYFTKRNLQANADLYGSFVYTALGVPSDFCVALAMLSRVPGVLAHWREAMSRPPELWRPLQIYTGPTSVTV